MSKSIDQEIKDVEASIWHWIEEMKDTLKLIGSKPSAVRSQYGLNRHLVRRMRSISERLQEDTLRLQVLNKCKDADATQRGGEHV